MAVPPDSRHAVRMRPEGGPFPALLDRPAGHDPSGVEGCRHVFLHGQATALPVLEPLQDQPSREGAKLRRGAAHHRRRATRLREPLAVADDGLSR